MKILLTNDDGIHAPGLHALRDALAELGDVTVVAPATEQSGVGLSVTYLHPLLVHEEFRDGRHLGWAVAGSPADCVKLGMYEYCRPAPELVVSGINAGSNAGINVLYSGTVAGAIEGAFYGVTSIAVSRAGESRADDAVTAQRAVRLIRQMTAHGIPRGSLWNVNFPAPRPDWPLGVKVVRMGVRRHVDVMEKRMDPRGRDYFWSGLDPLENHHIEPGTDIAELAAGYVTLTPLHFDLTHAEQLQLWRALDWEL